MKKILAYFVITVLVFMPSACTKEDGEVTHEDGKVIIENNPDKKDIPEKTEAVTFVNTDFEKSDIILELSSANKNIEIEIITEQGIPIKILGGEPEAVFESGKPLQIFALTEKLGFEGKIISFKINECPHLNTVSLLSCPELNSFSCSFTNLSFVDFSGASGLLEVNLSRNRNLVSLQTGNLPLLETLDIEGSGVKEIDLSKNLNLKKLFCGASNIQTLEVSANRKLEILDIPYLNLKNIDIKNNSELLELNCSSNSLTELDLSENIKLTKLNCASNNISVLALFNNKNLEVLNCGKNKLENLFIENNIKLKDLFCSGNKLKFLNLSDNKNIENVYCFNNNISEIKINNNSSLKNIFCFNNCIDENNAKLLFVSLPPGTGYDFHTIVWYADENDGINYDSKKYFDRNSVLPKELIEQAYGNYWYVCHTLYGLEEINEILGSLKQKN